MLHTIMMSWLAAIVELHSAGTPADLASVRLQRCAIWLLSCLHIV